MQRMQASDAALMRQISTYIRGALPSSIDSREAPTPTRSEKRTDGPIPAPQATSKPTHPNKQAAARTSATLAEITAVLEQLKGSGWST